MVGEWVVLEGDALIAHGLDYAAVLEEARQAGIEIPFVVQIPEPRPPNTYFAGL
jgi:hypothetical protein